MAETDIDTFYKLVVHPNFNDEMDFRLTAANPENTGTFSKEGIDGITDQIHAFIMGRVFGRWGKTGKPPKEMTVHLRIEWADVVAEDLPWYKFKMMPNETGMEAIEGKSRIPRSKGA